MITAGKSTLIVVYAALMALLALTVGASQLGLGAWGPAVNMSIAALKAALIFWFFMHLGEASPLVRLAAIAALLWLFLLFALGIADWLTRTPA
jgi:cytochrome c oxidase subunit 4